MAEALESAPEGTVVLLTEAEPLHPYFRTRTIESRLHDRVKTPTVIFYPGRRSGQYGLHFLDFYPIDGNYEEFKKKYRERYPVAWEEIHNDPLIGVARAAEIVPRVLPDDFPTPESFRGLRFEEARDVRDLAGEILDSAAVRPAMRTSSC